MSNKRRAKRPAPTRRATPRRAPGGRNTWVLAGVAVTAVALAIGIAVAAGGGDGTEERTEIAAVEVEGEGLPTFTREGSDPAVGMAAPRLQGVGFDDQAVEVGGGGTPSVVVLVAHWCPHCQRDLPVVADVVAGAEPEGVEVVAVSSLASSERPNWPPSSWFDDVEWPGSVLVDDADGTAYQALGASGTPFTVVLDGEGRVLRRVSGEVGAEGFRQLLELARGSQR